ncbi:MAG TPA: hypothetical protein PLU87_13115 [Sedimentisphaerales bacterium]|mgnify:CR=1 FL=1|nr:hypothetical protein [Sedimentisphaerales bacterium]HRS11981.1 hypothetical protein [Sedimentisphaerales bacterium]HRV49037.1 hypothetical protein [Sedimentisphaerales bacterium]
MRLLIITNNPSRASFRQRIGIHLDLLRKEGIDCRIAKLPRGMLARRALFACARDFDGVLLHRKMLTAWDGFWMRHYGRRVIFDFDDAIMYNDRKPEQTSRIRMRRFGRSVALSCAVIAGNRYLADHARRYSANVHILPTALDVRAYDVKQPRPGDQAVRLVWIGRDFRRLVVRTTPFLWRGIDVVAKTLVQSIRNGARNAWRGARVPRNGQLPAVGSWQRAGLLALAEG